MSQTVPVAFRGAHFWAQETGMGVFLKYLLDAAARRAKGEHTEWLEGCIQHWRYNSGDQAFHLDEQWSQQQVLTVVELIDEACSALKAKPVISPEEMDTWPGRDDLGVVRRGRYPIRTEDIIELGEALRALLVGGLPPAPPGTWWIFGCEGGRSTIAMDEP